MWYFIGWSQIATGVQEGVVLHTEGSAERVRGAGRVVLLPGESTKGVRGAGKGGFAHGRVREECPGCRKGWFCTRGWLMEACRWEALPREGRATSGMEAGGPPRRDGGVSPKDELPTGEAPHRPPGCRKGRFAPQGSGERGSGCRKGWFCTRKGLRRGFGVQKGVVLLPGGCEKSVRGAGRVVLLPGESTKGVRGAEPLSFAPGRAVKTREEVKKWLKYRGIC